MRVGTPIDPSGTSPPLANATELQKELDLSLEVAVLFGPINQGSPGSVCLN